MVRGRDTSHGDTEPGRRNFSAVKEVCTEETNGDEEVEEEDEERRGDLRGLVRLGEAGGDGESKHARGHASAAEHEELAATETVNGKEGDEAGEELPGKSATGEDAGCLAVEAETLLEDDLEKD